MTHGTALEGALKVKEITYVHAEWMYSSEFKHGPLARVEEGYPVIFLSLAEDSKMIISHMNEVSCRKGKVIAIAPENQEIRKNADIFIPRPPAHDFMIPVLGLVPMQLLAYHWSVLRGIDPDLPRNLSKTLTVD
jgi:glucosamine--fructose-6-phosphate aminotransferase (isomerizing)